MKSRYDVIVAGAGIAGICAAVRAARMGAHVLIIEHYGFVGGMSTAGMVSPFMKHSIGGSPLTTGIFEEIESLMRFAGGMIDNGFYAHSFRSAAYKLLEEAGVTMFLNSEIISAVRSGNSIAALNLLSGSRKLSAEADIFIDTTGDAQVVFLGGFPWIKGDEKSGRLQALTLFFRMGGIDIRKAAEYAAAHRDDFFQWMEYNFDYSRIISVAGYFSIVKKAIMEKRLSPEIQYIFYTTLPSSGEASFNTSNILGFDASDSFELTRAEMTGRRQVNEVVKLLQEEIPGFENSYLMETAVQAGVRETRRGIGDYIVSGDDIKSGRKFEDSIARACYGIDIHGQKDEESRMEDIPDGEHYEVPLRAVIVKEADNLLVAGRCISATREGHSALRIMPTSAATGEACGALAALAALQQKSVREITYSELKNYIKHNI